jgi:hypothetical protein
MPIEKPGEQKNENGLVDNLTKVEDDEKRE